MKYIILFLGIALLSLETTAQPMDLGKMAEKQRREYLIKLAKEVTRIFGPGYYREYKEPIISEIKKYHSNDKRPEIAKNIGREFYRVTFLYDKSKETLEWDFASEVDIWKDTGEPKGVIFGNGYGRNFFFTPYKEQITQKVSIVPYQQATPRDTNIFR